MRIRLPALAALLPLLALLAPPPAAAVEPGHARNAPCTGIYTGSARGVFWVRSGKAMLFATVRCG